MCSFMVPWTHTCLPRKLHLNPFSRFCRIPLIPSHRARVVGPISFCACHTIRSNNCLACIYTRHKTGLKSSQVILYWNSHDDKSASILSSDRSIDANRCAQIWCSGTDGKYPSTAPRRGCNKPAARRCCLLAMYRQDRQTDTVPIHRS